MDDGGFSVFFGESFLIKNDFWKAVFLFIMS